MSDEETNPFEEEHTPKKRKETKNENPFEEDEANPFEEVDVDDKPKTQQPALPKKDKKKEKQQQKNHHHNNNNNKQIHKIFQI